MTSPPALSAAALGRLALLGGSLAGCARHATVADCDALLDRYVELLVREQDPSAGDAEMARQKGMIREKAAQDSAFASCPKEVTAHAARCALAAPNVDEFEKCLE
jgi:hypothetical protein